MFPERLRPVEFKNDCLNGVHSRLREENSIPKTLLQCLRAPSKLPRRVTHRTKALLLLYMFKATTGRHFTSGKSRRHDNDDAAIRPSRDQNRVRAFSRIWVRGYHGDCHAYGRHQTDRQYSCLYMLGGGCEERQNGHRRCEKTQKWTAESEIGRLAGSLVQTDIHGGCEEWWQVQSFRVFEVTMGGKMWGMCCL